MNDKSVIKNKLRQIIYQFFLLFKHVKELDIAAVKKVHHDIRS